MSANPQDSHLKGFEYVTDETDTERELLNGTGKSETIKITHSARIVVANKTFVGYPTEDDIDIVMCESIICGPNEHFSRPGGQNFTIKGASRDIHLVGNFGKAVIGQYSNYDRWFAIGKTKGITFDPDAKGQIELWYAEKLANVPKGVEVKTINPFIVRIYFLWRSLQQTLGQR
jgi:hypothetical protein